MRARAGCEDAELLDLRGGDRMADVKPQRRPTRRHDDGFLQQVDPLLPDRVSPH